MDAAVNSELINRLEALDEAREIAARYFNEETVSDLDLVRAKVRARLRHGTEHTVVAIAGATGSGKSSIVNRLADAQLSEASVRRPTTSSTHAVVWGDQDAGPLLDWLEVSRRHRVPDGDEDLEGLVLLDLPDHDSTAVEHRIEVDRLVELVDILVWVTDPQKYADAALHLGYIQPLANHAGMLRFALNQVDRLDDGGAKVSADFARLLREDGIENASVLSISAATGEGFDDLRAALRGAVEARTASLVHAHADLVDASNRLATTGSLNDTKKSVGDLVEGLSEAAGSVDAATVAERHHRRQGSLAMGWPFTRFLRRLARKPLADLPGPGRSSAAAPRADVALRDFAEQVAGDSTAPWPNALRSAVGAQRDELLDDLRRVVGRETVKAGERPRWWTAVAWLQRLLAITAIVGLGWLLVVAILGGFFQIATDPLLPPTPEAEWMPLPSALLLGGVVAGLIVGLLVRLPLSVGAQRRGRRARKAIERRVQEHAETRVIAPVTAVVEDHATLDSLRRKAAG